MRQQIELTHSLLKELLNYDPATGIFTWRVDRKSGHFGNKIAAHAGSVAGSLTNQGYHQICIGKNYLSHRVAWYWMTGGWPSSPLDHINGTRSDNRWGNLREVTNRMNCENQRKAKVTNRTGFLGVIAPSGKRTKFQAEITANGKRIYLGVHPTAELAHSAYLEAKRQLHEGGTL